TPKSSIRSSPTRTLSPSPPATSSRDSFVEWASSYATRDPGDRDRFASHPTSGILDANGRSMYVRRPEMGEWRLIGPASNRAYLALPNSGAGAGVLVLHAWWGLTSVFTDVCDRLAAAGFVALAPGLYPNGATAETIPEAEALVAAHDSEPKLAEAI